MRSYTDSNYTSSQIITPAGNPGTDTGYSGDMKWRQGRNSTWLDWKTILDSNNYTTYCTPANIGAATSSHTHTGSEVILTGYLHRDSYETINENDTVNQAIAKLERALSGLEDLLASI